MYAALPTRLRTFRKWLALALVAAVAGVGVWYFYPSSSTAPVALQTTRASRGNVVVSVAGSGPVSAFGFSPASGTSAPAGATPAQAAASSASGVTVGLPVFPSTTGQLVRLLVTPGEKVRAGQVVALLSDPAAASAIVQAQVGVQTAQLALSGAPASAQEVAAGQLAVDVARKKLGALSTPPKQTAVTKARLDLATAQAAYDALRKAPASPSATALTAAKLAITLAQQKLGVVYQPATQAAVLSAQEAVSQAQAKLNGLQAAPAGPLPSEVNSALLALTLAEQQLAALKNPTPADATAARLAVSQAQAKLDALRAAPAPPDPAALTAAQQGLAVANANLDAVTAPRASRSAVLVAQRDLRAANERLAALRGSSQFSAAQQAVAQASQRLSGLVSSPALASMSQARIDLLNAKAAYETLRKAPVPPARTALDAAAMAVTLARQSLAQLSAPPDPSAVGQARLDLANARTALSALQVKGVPATPAEIALDQLKLQSARDALRVAELHQQSLVVRAPIPGTVTSILARPGVQVDATTPVLAIADLKRLFVSINMSEFDVANIRIGDRATVDVAALGGTSIAARVVAIAPVGVNNGGVVQFPVTVALTKAPVGLRPGMLASVTVVTAERKAVVRVPVDVIGTVASGDNAGESTVTSIDPAGRQRVHVVVLGLAGAGYVQVLKGVTPGERLVLPQVAVAPSGGGGGAGGAGPAGIGVPPAQADNQGGGGGGGG